MQINRFGIRCLVICAALCGPTAFAQNIANQGSLSASGRNHVFKHIVAVRGEWYREPRIIVLATGQKIEAAALAKAQKVSAEDNLDVELGQPYLKAVFLESGELRCLIGRGASMSFGSRGEPLEGKATIKNDRIVGEVKIKEGGTFAKEVMLTFDVPIGGGDKGDKPVALDPAVKPSVEGKFTGDGKDGNLKFVTVQDQEPFNDKEALAIIFTEKDPSKSKNVSFDAGFKKLGSALILRVNTQGSIFGCEVAHMAHSQGAFSSIGKIHMVEFDLAGGNAKGRVSTGGEDDTFGQKWDVDLKFAAPLTEKMRSAMTQPKIAKVDPKSETTKTEPKAKPTGPMIAARKIELPAEAKNVIYKQLVEHINFESDLNVAQMVAAFSAKLQAQGWKEAPGGLIGKKNAMMKRTHGDAKLSITIQPTETGSKAIIFTEGLDWKTGAEEQKPTKSAPQAAGDAKKEARDLINKALKDLPPDARKGIPKGLLDDLE